MNLRPGSHEDTAHQEQATSQKMCVEGNIRFPQPEKKFYMTWIRSELIWKILFTNRFTIVQGSKELNSQFTASKLVRYV